MDATLFLLLSQFYRWENRSMHREVQKFLDLGASLMVQWIRLPAPNARDLGSIPGQEVKMLHAATKTQHNQYK